jgi:hypothetical protein
MIKKYRILFYQAPNYRPDIKQHRQLGPWNHRRAFDIDLPDHQNQDADWYSKSPFKQLPCITCYTFTTTSGENMLSASQASPGGYNFLICLSRSHFYSKSNLSVVHEYETLSYWLVLIKSIPQIILLLPRKDQIGEYSCV